MTNSTPLVLAAIDDNRESLDLVRAALEGEGFEILLADDPVSGLEMVRRRRPDIVLLDLMMPRMDGMEVLDEIVKFDPSIEVVLVTAHYSTESAVNAVRRGASDYIEKPIDITALRQRLARLAAGIRLRRRVGDADALVVRGIVGRSRPILDMFARIGRIGPHFRSVLVTGPTGTGKELVARALHEASPAASGPFVVCNCGAIAENLVESELFGHVRGAFTGAVQDRPGLFEYAGSGSLLLDEIGEMPLAAQAKLLRAVQHQEVQRVGSPRAAKVNVRVIAATHRDLKAMVRAGTFREDLYFRLGIVEVKVPTLDERREDIPLLARHFARHYSNLYAKPLEGLSHKAEALLARRHWPGNVRELEGVVGYAAMMAEPPLIEVADLPESLRTPLRKEEPGDLGLSLDQMQVVHAGRVLEHLGGDKARAAKVLGVSRATLYRLLARQAGA